MYTLRKSEMFRRVTSMILIEEEIVEVEVVLSVASCQRVLLHIQVQIGQTISYKLGLLCRICGRQILIGK